MLIHKIHKSEDYAIIVANIKADEENLAEQNNRRARVAELNAILNFIVN